MKERLKRYVKSRPFVAAVAFLIGSTTGHPELTGMITNLGCALVGC